MANVQLTPPSRGQIQPGPPEGRRVRFKGGPALDSLATGGDRGPGGHQTFPGGLYAFPRTGAQGFGQTRCHLCRRAQIATGADIEAGTRTNKTPTTTKPLRPRPALSRAEEVVLQTHFGLVRDPGGARDGFEERRMSICIWPPLPDPPTAFPPGYERLRRRRPWSAAPLVRQF
ncbi:hypothetical protein GWK47_048959 [Chionoecetes opilio]|uniref:Uncharacterized protein n=1 Tax=Chionoecetes opilio TaxID=41210 RepID=A0A8J5CFE7_CHIOP|nr:hypothetical protein GWK47_048959 [Chionoecetes opilio]